MTASSTGGGTIYVDADVEVAMASGDAAADAIFANVGAAEIMSEANANGEDYASAFAGANVAIFEEEEEDDEGLFGTSFPRVLPTPSRAATLMSTPRSWEAPTSSSRSRTS
jgi:hypothetical protein